LDAKHTGDHGLRWYPCIGEEIAALAGEIGDALCQLAQFLRLERPTHVAVYNRSEVPPLKRDQAVDDNCTHVERALIR